MSDLGNLYGVGGQVYAFIHQARNNYNWNHQSNMAKRAQELLDLIAAHDREVERIAREVTAECKSELAAEAS